MIAPRRLGRISAPIRFWSVVTQTNDKQLLTAEELAERIRVRPSTIRIWAREGLIPAVKIGAKILRFDMDDVLESVKGREPAS